MASTASPRDLIRTASTASTSSQVSLSPSPSPYTANGADDGRRTSRRQRSGYRGHSPRKQKKLPSLSNWLKKIGLSAYEAKMKEEGVELIDLLTLQKRYLKETLDDLGLSPMDKESLVIALKKLRRKFERIRLAHSPSPSKIVTVVVSPSERINLARIESAHRSCQFYLKSYRDGLETLPTLQVTQRAAIEESFDTLFSLVKNRRTRYSEELAETFKAKGEALERELTKSHEYAIRFDERRRIYVDRYLSNPNLDKSERAEYLQRMMKDLVYGSSLIDTEGRVTFDYNHEATQEWVKNDLGRVNAYIQPNRWPEMQLTEMPNGKRILKLIPVEADLARENSRDLRVCAFEIRVTLVVNDPMGGGGPTQKKQKKKGKAKAARKKPLTKEDFIPKIYLVERKSPTEGAKKDDGSEEKKTGDDAGKSADSGDSKKAKDSDKKEDSPIVNEPLGDNESNDKLKKTAKKKKADEFKDNGAMNEEGWNVFTFPDKLVYDEIYTIETRSKNNLGWSNWSYPPLRTKMASREVYKCNRIGTSVSDWFFGSSGDFSKDAIALSVDTEVVLKAVGVWNGQGTSETKINIYDGDNGSDAGPLMFAGQISTRTLHEANKEPWEYNLAEFGLGEADEVVFTPGSRYTIELLQKGEKGWYCNSAKESVLVTECATPVTWTFYNAKQSPNSTRKNRGQFGLFTFYAT